MAGEFNPSKKDLFMIESLILEIKSKKEDLIKRKIIIQDSLSTWKEKYATVQFQSKEYFNIKRNRGGLKEQFNKLEIEIKLLNDELAVKNRLRKEIEFFLANNKALEGKDDLEKIISRIKTLKIKYANFTKDRTRIASLRIMASEILEELDNVLKP